MLRFFAGGSWEAPPTCPLREGVLVYVKRFNFSRELEEGESEAEGETAFFVKLKDFLEEWTLLSVERPLVIRG